MSDCNDLIEVVRAKNARIDELLKEVGAKEHDVACLDQVCADQQHDIESRDIKIQMLQAQNAEWQEQFEALHSLYVTLIDRYLQEFNKNKRAQ